MEHLTQIILLLGLAVVVIVIFQHLRIPGSLGYLLVGLMLGPHTAGPVVAVPEFAVLAEFGVVFLLFTMGLNYSLPQLHALRHQILWLGTAQVVLTTIVVWVFLWLIGLPGAAAFVIGAVFAQSSSTIIATQLAEQGELNSHHGRLGLAMSVFQDVTAVPFLVVIPVLGLWSGVEVLAAALGLAVAKAALVFILVFFLGRRLLRPLFHWVAKRRSAEVFTLAVLLAALLAGSITFNLGLSLAFGAFLAGMMLGETEFRHQVESSIRPFRDVLLGLFFIGIGMRIDPALIPSIGHWALLGALVLLVSKLLIVVVVMRRAGLEPIVAWRSGLLLAIGGEFGFALLALGLDAHVVETRLGQIVMASILISLIIGAILIRFNESIARHLVRTSPASPDSGALPVLPESVEKMVVIGGYGRVGHTIAVLLQSSGVECLILDTNAGRVARGHNDGHRVIYGDISDSELLSALHIERAALVVLATDSSEAALRTVAFLREHCPQVPVIARAWDLQDSSQLLEAGVTHAYPEAIEASLRLGATALHMLAIPVDDVDQLIQGVRDWDYKPIIE